MSSRSLAPFLFAAALSLAGVARADEDRGYLGALLGPVPEALAKHLGTKTGAIVEEVAAGSPAEKAGLKHHDVLTAVGGAAVEGPEAFKKLVRSSKPGEQLRIELQRGGEKLEVTATLGSLAEASKAVEKNESADNADKPAKPHEEKQDAGAEAKRSFFGVGFGDVAPILAEHLGLAEGVGVSVEDVWAGSPAEKAGIEKRDVLVALDGYEIKGAADFARLVGEKKIGDKVKVDRVHKGAMSSVELTLVERPEGLAQGSDDPFHYQQKTPDPKYFNRVQPYFHGPGITRRGRIIVEGPQGRSWQFEIPDGVMKAEELSRDIGVKMKDLQKQLEKEIGKIQQLIDPEELGRRVQRLTDELEDIKQDAPDGSRVTSEVRSSVIRHVEGGFDITIQDQNGARTVTVKQGDKTLAENLAWDQRETLAPEVKERVERVAAGLKPAVVPKLRVNPDEPRIKA